MAVTLAGRVGCIRGELVRMRSELYEFTLAAHPDAVDKEGATWGSAAELVRRLAPNGESWLVLKHWPERGAKESQWRAWAADEPGLLTYTGEQVVLEVDFAYAPVSRYQTLGW